MKKILSLCLAFCMILSLSAFAYTDVKDMDYVSEAVTVLSDIGIINGFEDGSYKPEDAVTRAQMAKIICQMLGYGDVAPTASSFDDVAADHWAAGYIETIKGLGIINGYGDGRFGPENAVTYEQAVKMIVLTLGYGPMVDSMNGDYPTVYLNVANKIDILDNVKGTIGEVASRGLIAVLVYNALDVQLMDQETWKEDGSNEFAKSTDTILTKYLKLEKYTGIITSAPRDDKSDDVVLSDVVYHQANYTEDVTSLTVNNLYDREVKSFIGKAVTVYVEATGKKKVLVSIVEDNNEVLVINSKDLVADDSEVIYDKDNKDTKVKVTDKVNVVINYENVGSQVVTSDELIALCPNGTLTFVDNNVDGRYDTVVIFTFTGEAVINKVSTYGTVYEFDYATEVYGNTFFYDIDVEDEVYIEVIKDGKIDTLSSLENDDVISFIYDNDYYYIVASSNKLVGSIESTRVKEGITYVTFDGVEYESKVTDIDFNDNVYYLNSENVIVYVEAGKVATNNYGLILAAGETTESFEAGYQVEVMWLDGTKKIYDLSDRVRLGDTAGDEDVYAALGSGRVNSSEIPNRLYEVTIKDNKVTKLKAVSAEYSYTDKIYDAETMTYGPAVFDENTIVVSIDDSVSVEVSDITIGTVGMFTDGGNEGTVIYGYVSDDNTDVVSIVLATNLSVAVSETGAAFIVESQAQVKYNDETVIQLTGLQAGKEVSYIFYNEDGFDADPADLVFGDVILVGNVSNNVVSDYIKLPKDADKVEHYTGVVTEVNDRYFIIDEKQVNMTASANYTLVDMDEETISRRSKGTSLFGSLKQYDVTALVRYYDEKLVEVIVYRTSK